MPITRYEVALTGRDFIRVRIVYAERGRDVLDFTVQYETVIDGRTYPVVRYDTAHGDPHRDLLDAEGRVIDKLWLPGWNRTIALDHARDDIRANWSRYRSDFIPRMP